jgi:hypothetical protein
MIFDPLHFLPLIEQKVGALDQAAPLQGWDLPDVFASVERQPPCPVATTNLSGL